MTFAMQQLDRFSVISCYGPITYMPCPVLVFKEVGSGSEVEDGFSTDPVENKRFVLVAAGSLSSVDPDRIVLKKVTKLHIISVIYHDGFWIFFVDNSHWPPSQSS
jgi:hypothetical protein